MTAAAWGRNNGKEDATYRQPTCVESHNRVDLPFPALLKRQLEFLLSARDVLCGRIERLGAADWEALASQRGTDWPLTGFPCHRGQG